MELSQTRIYPNFIVETEEVKYRVFMGTVQTFNITKLTTSRPSCVKWLEVSKANEEPSILVCTDTECSIDDIVEWIKNQN